MMFVKKPIKENNKYLQLLSKDRRSLSANAERYLDLYPDDNLHPVLRTLLYYRIQVRLNAFLDFYNFFTKPIMPKEAITKIDEKFEEGLKSIAINEFFKFASDLAKYKKDQKEDILDTLNRAEDGDLKAIRRLLKWDKAVLGLDAVLQPILYAQYNGDNDFLESVADSFKKQSKKQLRSHNKEVIMLVKHVFDLMDAANMGKKEKRDFLSDLQKAIETSLPEVLDERAFFRRFERQGII